ncbi:MAG: efflux RND transporter periplasmic adaptor subunit [Paracoccaceae bacterium]
MKALWIIVGLAVLGGGYGYWEWSRAEVNALTDPPVTIPVELGTVERTVLASGVIEAGSLVSVGARVSGLIETLAVELGDTVAEGDLIAQIESLDQQNQVLQAEADLAQIDAQIAAAEASLREAELGMTRQRQLSERNLSSDVETEAAEAGLAVAVANLKSLNAQRARAEVAVTSARLALTRTRITAPVAGTVVAVVISQGQTVNASNSTPTIVKIADLTRMVVNADVSEADITRVTPGQAATLTLLGEPDTPIAATLRAIEPAPASIEESDTIATDEAIYYVALIDVPNPDGKLRIGMTAEVRIRLERAEGVPVVLSSVLGKVGEDGSYEVEVWDPVTSRREMRVVTIGVTDNISAEVTTGLAEGDLVVGDRTSGTSAAANIRRPPGMF